MFSTLLRLSMTFLSIAFIAKYSPVPHNSTKCTLSQRVQKFHKYFKSKWIFTFTAQKLMGKEYHPKYIRIPWVRSPWNCSPKWWCIHIQIRNTVLKLLHFFNYFWKKQWGKYTILYWGFLLISSVVWENELHTMAMWWNTQDVSFLAVINKTDMGPMGSLREEKFRSPLAPCYY